MEKTKFDIDKDRLKVMLLLEDAGETEFTDTYGQKVKIKDEIITISKRIANYE